ncbi:cytochrome b5 domain-containing protein [Patescibacteria group bacterium]
MSRLIMVIIAVVVVVAVGWFFFGGGSSPENSNETNTTQNVSGGEESEGDEDTEVMEKEELTMQLVSTHSAEGDCWIVIDGKVYDVSSFIPKHPGEEAILEGCGIDATELFETRPMGSGTPHSERARGMLEQFYIGDLQ